MALKSQPFTQALPSVPTLTKGMMLGTTGVTAPPLQTIGTMASTSAANGSFSDVLGRGQLDYDSSGFLYCADSTNARVQRFTKNASGILVYDSQCTSLNALGSAVTMDIVCIDRVRSQIHLASSQQSASGTWVGVWDLSAWPGLTVGNRVRSYGTHGTSGNASGKAISCFCLTIVGDESIACSSAGDFRVIKWNHTTGTLVAEVTKSLWMARFASDGTKYYSGAQATNTELGLWRINPATLVGITRLDSGAPAGFRYSRRNYLVQGAGGDIGDLVYYNNRVYVRQIFESRILAWSTLTDTFADEFLWSGGASPSVSFGHAPGTMFSQLIQQSKMGIAIGGASQSDDFLAWSGNADNTSTQSFLTCWPCSTATATWVKSDFSADDNVLKLISVCGENLAGEKYKLRLKKNAGSFVTITADKLCDEDLLATLGTFTTGDTLTVELSLSTWDRLDGHATLLATRDKLTPANVSVHLIYNDPLGDIFVPQQTSLLAVQVGSSGGIAVEI